MILLRFSFTLLLTCILSCQSGTRSDIAIRNSDPWSVRIAEDIIQNHESLVYYDKSPGKEKLQYDVAMLGMAMDKLGSTNEKYSAYMKEYVDFFIDSAGNISKYRVEEYNLDRINFAKNIITLYKRTGNQKYYNALQLFVSQIENHPKTNSGGFWHKKVYKWQMWLDGSYMAMPFIAQFAKEFNKPEWFDLASEQLIHMYEVTLDKKSGLLYHAWDESKQQKWCNQQTGQSKIFWGRSIGWYTMAIVDVLEFLPEDHPNREKIIEIFQNTVDALIGFRDAESGLWYQVLDQGGREKNYLETSCSAMYTYAIAKGIRFNYLPASYKTYAVETFQGIIDRFLEENSEGGLILKNIVGGCGLGGKPYRDGSYEYYVTEMKVDNDPKGIGALLLAAIELNK